MTPTNATFALGAMQTCELAIPGACGRVAAGVAGMLRLGSRNLLLSGLLAGPCCWLLAAAVGFMLRTSRLRFGFYGYMIGLPVVK